MQNAQDQNVKITMLHMPSHDKGNIVAYTQKTQIYIVLDMKRHIFIYPFIIFATRVQRLSPSSILCWVRVALVFCVVFCRLMFVLFLLVIVLSYNNGAYAQSFMGIFIILTLGQYLYDRFILQRGEAQTHKSSLTPYPHPHTTYY